MGRVWSPGPSQPQPGDAPGKRSSTQRDDDRAMVRRMRSDRLPSITTAPESPAEELGRRQRRYAVMAAIFIASFTSAAVLHRDTVLAVLLCGVAMTTLLLSVILANVRSPRQSARPGHLIDERRQLRSSPGKRPPPET